MHQHDPSLAFLVPELVVQVFVESVHDELSSLNGVCVVHITEAKGLQDLFDSVSLI